MNEELVPIKIEKIPGNYRLFNLVFIIYFLYPDNFFLILTNDDMIILQEMMYFIKI